MNLFLIQQGGGFRVTVSTTMFLYEIVLFVGICYEMQINKCTLQGTNISRFQGTFEDDFPFPQVGYVNSLEGIVFSFSCFVFLHFFGVGRVRSSNCVGEGAAAQRMLMSSKVKWW